MSRRFTGLWRHSDFLKLWSGQTFSLFGSLVGRIALPFLMIYTLNATAAQVAWVRAAEVAPGIVVGLLAGVWIDRLRRRPIMIWADVARALLTFSIPVALWQGYLSLYDVGARSIHQPDGGPYAGLLAGMQKAPTRTAGCQAASAWAEGHPEFLAAFNQGVPNQPWAPGHLCKHVPLEDALGVGEP